VIALPSRGRVTRTGEQRSLAEAVWLRSLPSAAHHRSFRVQDASTVSHNVPRYSFSFVPAHSTLHELLVSTPRFFAVAYLSEVL